MVNQLWSNILWGQHSNFVGVPTDCPQRDERFGWSANAQVFWRTATYNMDLTTFSQKYAADLRGTQAGTAMYGIFAPGVDTQNPCFGAAWSDAGVVVPWTGWIQSGNPKIIDENWDGMEHYLAELLRNNPDHLWRKGFGAAFGDWLTPTITTPEDLLATAYWAYDVSLMKQIALATGRAEAAARYTDEFAQIKAAFGKAYVRGDGFVGTVNHYPHLQHLHLYRDSARLVHQDSVRLLALGRCCENLRPPRGCVGVIRRFERRSGSVQPVMNIVYSPSVNCKGTDAFRSKHLSPRKTVVDACFDCLEVSQSRTPTNSLTLNQP